MMMMKIISTFWPAETAGVKVDVWNPRPCVGTSKAMDLSQPVLDMLPFLQ